jgi:hypothetical protein
MLEETGKPVHTTDAANLSPVARGVDYREGFEGVAHSEPTETAIQRHIDNGGAVPRQGDLVVLVKKYCS